MVVLRKNVGMLLNFLRTTFLFGQLLTSASPFTVARISAISRVPVSFIAFDDYSIEDNVDDIAYQDSVVGDGKIAEDGNVVTVAYRGILMSNRKQFDEGTGISFRLGSGKVIPGWEKGISGMRVGGKRVLKIPPCLAYGERGAGDVIPPNSHLEFDCELVGIASSQIDETVALLNLSLEQLALCVFLLAVIAVSPIMSN